MRTNATDFLEQDQNGSGNKTTGIRLQREVQHLEPRSRSSLCDNASASNFTKPQLIDINSSSLPEHHEEKGELDIASRVSEIAKGLSEIATQIGNQLPKSADDLPSIKDCIAFLDLQFRIRRLRGRHLPGLALGEPAWDMLLDLAVAHYWRRETSVTSLCIAADVPNTTALRWINSMTKAGLIVRRPCERDGRRTFLAISLDTYRAMLAISGDAIRAEEKVRGVYRHSGQ